MDREDGLAERIRKGDIRAFESLFRSSWLSLVQYARSMLRDKDDAEEIVQDLFFRLWRDRDSIDISTSLNAYLFRSVYNRSMKYFRHLRVRENFRADMSASTQETAETPLDTYRLKELNGIVARTLERLPERCGEIFYMNRFEGLKYREIAEKLSISVKTVEANMGRALKEFRKALSEQ